MEGGFFLSEEPSCAKEGDFFSNPCDLEGRGVARFCARYEYEEKWIWEDEIHCNLCK
jgi:hypothetical protein